MQKHKHSETKFFIRLQQESLAQYFQEWESVWGREEQEWKRWPAAFQKDNAKMTPTLLRDDEDYHLHQRQAARAWELFKGGDMNTCHTARPAPNALLSGLGHSSYELWSSGTRGFQKMPWWATEFV